MALLTFGPSEVEVRRKPIKFVVKGKDPDDEDAARELAWRPQKLSAMMFGAGLLDGDTDIFSGDETAQASAGSKATKAMLDWFANGLPDEDEDWLIGRLKDPDDWFDFSHLNEITKALIGLMSGRPTGSRKG